MAKFTYPPLPIYRGTGSLLARLTLALAAAGAMAAVAAFARRLRPVPPMEAAVATVPPVNAIPPVDTAPPVDTHPPVDTAPPVVTPRLTAAIATVAAAHGDPVPRAVTVTATTLPRALVMTRGGHHQPQGDGTPVYLVVMHGRFTALASPPGTPPARGACLYLVLDRVTLAVLDMTIAPRPPQDAGAGTAVPLGHP